MKHIEGLEGKKVRLAQAARWRNFCNGEAHVLPAGTVLELVSYRPEGYNAKTESGEFFFLFARYLETAEEIQPQRRRSAGMKA